jgi:hypothetical protein
MSTTTRSRIVLPLPRLLSERHDMLMSLLASGWVQVTYRRGCGQVVQRLATRNPSLIATFGCVRDGDAVQKSDSDWNATGLCYYDYTRGGIRSFYVEDVIEVAIPADCPENCH